MPRTNMTFDELDDCCRSFPGAVLEHPFGPELAVYKVGNKIFALSWLGDTPGRVNLKCEPLVAEQLRLDFPESILPGYHMNKRHWNTIVLDGSLDAAFIVEMVEDSYDLIVAALPKRLRPAGQ